MSVSPVVARARWAAFVERALADARSRGMTDPDIKAATGIGPSTFHRWQGRDGGLPQIDKVISFCVGLDIPLAAALAALGVSPDRPAPPEPTPDPDLTRLGRLLNDPAVSEAEKQAIRHTVRMLSRAAKPADPEPAQ